MLSRIFIIIASTFLLCTTTCNLREDKKALLPADTLVAIIYDLHLADGVYSLPSSRTGIVKGTDTLEMYGYIFEKHGTTKAIFDSSMGFYSEKPDELEKIYEKVLSQLESAAALLDSTTRTPM